MDETLNLELLCEQCDLDPCECEDWIMKTEVISFCPECHAIPCSCDDNI